MEITDKNNSIKGRLAKEALQECEQKFQILLDTISEGVTIHDKFKIIEANREYCALFGYDYYEIVGRDVLEFVAPQYRDLVMQKFSKEDEAPFKITALKKDGAAIDVELCSRVIPHRDARLNLTLFRKLSDTQTTKYQENTLQKQLGEFFDYSPDAYYLADATGKFLDVNKAAVELFGHGKEDIIGKSFLKLNLLSPNQIRKAAAHLAFNIFGKPADPQEYVICRHDGSQIPVEITSIPVKTRGKSLLFGIVRDITEKKKSADALRRAVNEIETLVAERRTAD